MYFKTLKDSETGQKITRIKEKMSNAFGEAQKIANEVNADKWRSCDKFPYAVVGGISSFLITKNIPEYFKPLGGPNEYMPNLTKKEGKALQERINQLPKVTHAELNLAVGYNNDTNCIGYVFDSKYKWYLFSLHRDWDYTPPADCLEITASEYKLLAIS